MVRPTGFMDRAAGDWIGPGWMSRTISRSRVQTEAGKSGEFMKMRVALFTASLLAGCARIQDVGSLGHGSSGFHDRQQFYQSKRTRLAG
jgi:hypothetical protein